MLSNKQEGWLSVNKSRFSICVKKFSPGQKKFFIQFDQRAKNLVALSRTVCTRVWGSKNFGEAGARPAPLGLGVADPVLHTRVILPTLVALGQTAQACVRKSSPTRWAVLSAFQCLSGHWNPHGSIHEFLLVIHSNHGPISCRFRDKLRFLSKIEKNCPTPRYLTPLMRDLFEIL